MKAIRTKFYGPGNVKGSRYGASDEDGNRIFLSADDSLSSEGNHDRAALALCAKMGRTNRLVRGSLGKGNVYVFDEPNERVGIRKGVA